MPFSNSSGAPTPGKPVKPHPTFPLFAHSNGQWCKKIRGRLHYFGIWADPDAALTKHLEQKDAWHAGRKPRVESGEVSVKDVANAFLPAKTALLESGELSPHTWANYKRATDTLVAHLGKMQLVADLDPEDFTALRIKMAKRWGPHRLAVTIQHIRSVFKRAYDTRKIPVPVNFGPDFKRPTKKNFRLHRAKQGPKLFAAAQIHQLLAIASTPMRAMILLGINSGQGSGFGAHGGRRASNGGAAGPGRQGDGQRGNIRTAVRRNGLG